MLLVEGLLFASILPLGVVILFDKHAVCYFQATALVGFRHRLGSEPLYLTLHRCLQLALGGCNLLPELIQLFLEGCLSEGHQVPLLLAQLPRIELLQLFLYRSLVVSCRL